jgi:serine/threonine-protein kinase
VGATLFTMLSGRLVHQGDTPNELLIATATQRAPSLAHAAPWVAPAVVALVDRALAFEAMQRWPSAAAMQQALRLAFHNPGATIAKPSFPEGQTVAAGPLFAALPRPGLLTTSSGSTSVQGLPSVVHQNKRPQVLFVGLGLPLVVGLLGWMGVSWNSPALQPAGSTSALVPSVLSAPGISASSPSVSPVSPSSSPSAPSPTGTDLPSGSNTVRVFAKGGPCQLKVNGTEIGIRSEFQLELNAGEHRLSCRHGKTIQEKTIRVVPGVREDVFFAITTNVTQDPRDRRR